MNLQKIQVLHTDTIHTHTQHVSMHVCNQKPEEFQTLNFSLLSSLHFWFCFVLFLAPRLRFEGGAAI